MIDVATGRNLLARWLAAALLALTVTLPLAAGERTVGPVEGDLIEVLEPAPDEVLIVEASPGQTVRLSFDAFAGDVRMEGDDLVLALPRGGTVVLKGLRHPDLLESGITLSIGDAAIPAADLVSALSVPLATSAGPPPAAANGDAESIVHTGRSILFAGESEEPGYALYSYLLFQRNDQAGVNFARRVAALDGYLSEIDEAERLEAHGITRADINILYLPLQPVPDAGPNFDDMRISIADLDAEAVRRLLLERYDFARARILLANLRLTGDGPYILTYDQPLGPDARVDRSKLMVQDLSRVPPELVRLWVVEFKREIANHRGGGDSLRPFALRLRTEIANIANAFSVTREAVAGFIDILE